MLPNQTQKSFSPDDPIVQITADRALLVAKGLQIRVALVFGSLSNDALHGNNRRISSGKRRRLLGTQVVRETTRRLNAGSSDPPDLLANVGIFVSAIRAPAQTNLLAGHV